MTNTLTPNTSTATRRRHWGRWAFIALQVLFVIWLITGLAGTTHPHAADCQGLDQQTCASVYSAGRTIGAGLMIGLWVAVDVIIGMIVLVVKLTRRH